MASHIFVKDISPESLAARDGNIQEGDVVLKVREQSVCRIRSVSKTLGLNQGSTKHQVEFT